MAACRREVMLGDVFKTESSFTHLNSVLIAARMKEGETVAMLSPAVCLQRLHDLKNMIHNMRKKQRVPYAGTVLTFPPSPSGLQELHDDIFKYAYPEGQFPVPSKVDATRIQDVKLMLPTRSTHCTVSARPQTGRKSETTSLALRQTTMQNTNNVWNMGMDMNVGMAMNPWEPLLQAFHRYINTQKRDEPDIPGFRYSQPASSRQPASERPGGTDERAP